MKEKIKKISKLLVANRSEIAIRIFQTAKKLGIETYAIYSDADADSVHIRFADHAIRLEGSTNQETYLNGNQIVKLAKENSIDAIHPGYGFLSEKSDFAKLVEESGIIFIGPNSKSIEMMGDKINSKKIAMENKVSVVPGFVGEITSKKQLHSIIKEIGLPVMIKASAGGGGKGMRIARNESEIEDFFEIVKAEAIKNYKDERIFIEKYIEEPRHIEIQIIGDKFGNIVCLGERECSIQRFNQKVIEEAPSLFVDEKLRNELYKDALKVAKAVGYYSAGTVEFIVDKNKNFYFLEMNTRLQVEHRVTEYINGGIDLVEMMINVATDEKLKIKQDDVQLVGHAIEARICSEDPSKNFMPSVGKITYYRHPEIDHYGNDIIIDTGVESGSVVTQFFDSMISKLIVYGDTREDAIRKMQKALNDYDIEGISTNIEFLQSIMKNKNFLSFDISTAFIKKEYPNGFKIKSIDLENISHFITAAVTVYLEWIKSSIPFDYNQTWQKIPNTTTYNHLSVIIEKNEYSCSIIESSEGFCKIEYNGHIINFRYNYSIGSKRILGIIDSDIKINMKVDKIDNSYFISSNGVTVKANVFESRIGYLSQYIKDTKEKKPNKILSPLNGMINVIKLEENQIFNAGDHLMTIEAMKMENQIFSEYKFKVIKVYKKLKDSAANQEVIADIECL